MLVKFPLNPVSNVTAESYILKMLLLPLCSAEKRWVIMDNTYHISGQNISSNVWNDSAKSRTEQTLLGWWRMSLVVTFFTRRLTCECILFTRCQKTSMWCRVSGSAPPHLHCLPPCWKSGAIVHLFVVVDTGTLRQWQPLSLLWSPQWWERLLWREEWADRLRTEGTLGVQRFNFCAQSQSLFS